MTLEQVRMGVAYETTRTFLAGDDAVTKGKAWKTVVVPFGTHVHRDGLLQALAFLARTPKDNELLLNSRVALVRAIVNHLEASGFLPAPQTNPAHQAQGAAADPLLRFLDQVRKLSAADYMLVTREVLAVSVWFKRAGQALAEREKK